MSNFGTLPPIMTGASKVCDCYRFDASAQYVEIIGQDVILAFLLVLNVTDGQVIYNPANPGTTGRREGNTLFLDFDTTSMSDDDRLLILCEPVVRDGEQVDLLKQLLMEARLQNLMLKDALELDFTTEDIT